MSAAAVAPTLVLISDRVCLPSVSVERLIPAAISVDRSSGRISAISTDASAIAAFRASGSTADVEVNDQGSLVLMAGLVDTHVHCNEPGRTNWEGLETATRAAAAGGVTTIVDMPLNSIPPTTTMEGLRAKEAAAVGKLTVDLGLWGGISQFDTQHDCENSLVPRDCIVAHATDLFVDLCRRCRTVQSPRT